jgi:iron complex outermembrane recepter protein
VGIPHQLDRLRPQLQIARFAAAALYVLSSSFSPAQVTSSSLHTSQAVQADTDPATLTGKIVDPDGQALPGVAITITPSSGRELHVTTDEHGTYTASGLKAGYAEIVIDARGMERITTSLLLHGGSNLLDRKLPLAQLHSTVVVQVEKRDEELDKTPVTVNLIDSHEIEQSGLHQIGDLDKDISNFLYADTGSRGAFDVVIMRGFANNTNSIDPSVAIYLDGVPINDFFSINQQLLDVDHIEVLKGPQGALYGASSEAGVINVITRAPGNEYHGTVTGSYGSYNGYQSAISASGPIVKDRLLLGVAGSVDGRDPFVTGYVTGQGVNSQSSHNGRARLDWIPQERWRFSEVINGSHIGDGGSYVFLPTDLSLYNQTVLAGQPALGPYQLPFDIDGFSRLGTNSESNETSYFGQKFTFSGLVARREVASQYEGDGDFTPVPYLEENFRFRHTAWNEEFRVQSPNQARRWFWTAGTSFLNDTRRNQDTISILPDNPYGQSAAALQYGNPRLTSFIPAVFGQVSARFFQQRLGLTAGIRGEWLTRSLLRQPNDFGISYNGTIHESIALPSFIADYRISPNLFAYYSLGRGWIPGGENIYATTEDTALYKMQTSLSNEIGVKATQFHNVFAENLALFDTQIHDFQDTVLLTATTSFFGNAERAHARGVEIETALQPMRRIKLAANLGFVDSRYDRYIVNQATGLELNGFRIHSIPNKTANLSAQFELLRGSYLRGEWNEVGSRFEYDLTSGVSANALRAGGYATGNLLAGYDHKRWTLLVFANNVTDRRYFPWVFVGDLTSYGYNGGLGTPGTRRQVGFRTSMHF